MAAVKNVGDVHPKNPNLVWTEYQPGKFDWRGKATAKPAGKAMDANQMTTWAQSAQEASLLKIVNSQNAKAQFRKIAYDALEGNGYDMSTVDTSGTLDAFFKLTGKGKKSSTAASDEDNSDDVIANVGAKANVHVNGHPQDGGEITEKWYLNPSDKRVKAKFDLATKGGKIAYDKFVDTMKRKEPDYVSAVEVIQDLNEQYYEFITNDEQRFMISAGGAGVGKTYGFEKICQIENKKPFGPGDKPGDDDYDYFEAKDVTSGKQLAEILKSHNGKIILFDDTDAVLRRTDCSPIMKKATATTGKRMIGDPSDPSANFDFSGRIMIMTNKNLGELASTSEDAKAIISRSMMVSEIYLTVPETIEVMEERFQQYEFPQAPRLDDAAEDAAEREKVLDVIKKNKNNIDPTKFTTRTFQSIIIEKRRIEKVNAVRNNAAYAGGGLFSNKVKDWETAAVNLLTKAEENDFGSETVSFEKAKDDLEIVVLKPETVEKPFEFKFEKAIDFDMDIEKAETLLFGIEE